jgi:dTMP kinase
MSRGKYIVIEGVSGGGVTTQVNELTRRLQLAGLPIRTFKEPDTQSDLTARAIRQLTKDPRYPMNNKTEVLLYNAARSQSLDVIKKSIEQGVTCVVDRNYLTTLAISYYGRGDVPDYPTINTIINFAVGEMEPDLCIVLDAPVPVLKERNPEQYEENHFIGHDEDYMERVRAGYLWEAQQRKLPVLSAAEARDKVADSIWALVSKTLAERNTTVSARVSEPTSIKEIIDTASLQATQELAPEAVTATVEIPLRKNDFPTTKEDAALVSKDKDGKFSITEAGEAVLSEAVTSIHGNVYAFTEKLSPVTVAAAMARLSRRGDDMRITILDEFAGKAGKDGKLLQRVITAYGDDSVQQLSGLHFVVEGASNLLTKKLEWGRLASYLEQSTRYIYFDQKDDKGKFKYYTPGHLKPSIKKQYDAIMDTIFEHYSAMVRELTEHVRNMSTTPEKERDIAWQGATRAQACDAIRPVLPVATKATVGIFASGQALESLIMHLQSDTLPEARITGQELLEQARQVVPMFLERADKPERGGATIAYRATTHKHVADLAHEFLPDNHAASVDDPVTLLDYWPKNELDLVPDMLYEHSSLSRRDIEKQVGGWSYDQKIDVFNAYMGERLNRRHRPGRAIENAHYSWDLICDYGIFRDLQRHRMVDDLEWQELTPRYGYEIPKLVEEANLSDQFEACFDLSLKLHSILQQAGYALEAQYATLLGHRMRWRITYNAREAFHLHELRTTPQGHPGYRKLVLNMHEKLAEVHPLMADAMKFVNHGEDAELTRLAAERYTQYKLNQLT